MALATQLTANNTTSAPETQASFGDASRIRASKRGTGANSRIIKTSGIVKCRTLTLKWLTMQIAANVESETHSTRHSVADGPGTTGRQPSRFAISARASAASRSPKNPGEDFSTNRTGKKNQIPCG